MSNTKIYSIMNANDGNSQFISFSNNLLKEHNISRKNEILSEIFCYDEKFTKLFNQINPVDRFNDNQFLVKLTNYSSISNDSVIDLSLSCHDLNIEFLRNLNFLLGISDTFVIHSNLINNNFESKFFSIIKYIFIFKIYELYLKKTNNINLVFIVKCKNSLINEVEKKNLLKETLFKLFNECLDSSEFSIDQRSSLYECFSFKYLFIEYDHVLDMNNFKNEIISEISLTDKKKDDINVNSLSFELNKEKLTKIYQFSQSVIFIAFDTYRETLSKEFLNEMNIDKIYYNLLSTGYGILNNWSRIVNNGNYIKNFGSNVKEFIEKLNKEFNTQSKNFMWNEYALKKSDKLSDIIYKKIIKLFTKQLLMLQTQALDKFKDNLIESVGSNNDYDNEKFKLIQKIKDWFIINSSNLRIPELNFNINNALNELEQVLLDFAQKFNDSPIYKLLSLKKINKSVKNSSFKQTGMIVGFGLTAAARLKGFGNFQMVSSYSHGPHVFNFSIVNDKDIAEQEGQTRVKNIRIQPSLNFDVDL